MDTASLELDAPIGVIADTHGTLRDEALTINFLVGGIALLIGLLVVTR